MSDSPNPRAPEPVQPENLKSPMGPLMILLVPLVALIIYGILSN